MRIDDATIVAHCDKLPQQTLQELAFPLVRLADGIDVGVELVQGDGVSLEAKVPAEQVRPMCARGDHRLLLRQKGHIYT